MSEAGAERVRVLIADDQALVRSGFTMLIGSAEDLVVVGEASTGAEAVALAASARPDVILMDIRMPEMDGIEATRRIIEAGGEGGPRVLVLTTFDLDEYVYDALRAGASGFLLKDADPEYLLDAVRVIAQGDALLAPSVTRRLIAEFAQRPAPNTVSREKLQHLTERELEVLALVASGMTNAEIAEQLFISPATAKTHVSRIMMKLDARDRAQLVVVGYESGIVSPGSAPA